MGPLRLVVEPTDLYTITLHGQHYVPRCTCCQAVAMHDPQPLWTKCCAACNAYEGHHSSEHACIYCWLAQHKPNERMRFSTNREPNFYCAGPLHRNGRLHRAWAKGRRWCCRPLCRGNFAGMHHVYSRWQSDSNTQFGLIGVVLVTLDRATARC
jgi:hypothetical protein